MTRRQAIASVAFAPALAVVPGWRAKGGVQATLHLNPAKCLTPVLHGPKARPVAAKGRLVADDWTTGRRPV